MFPESRCIPAMPMSICNYHFCGLSLEMADSQPHNFGNNDRRAPGTACINRTGKKNPYQNAHKTSGDH
jgi:hypothetical protein